MSSTDNPKSDSMLHQGSAAFASGDYAAAMRFFTRARDLDPGAAVPWRCMGATNMMLGRLVDASWGVKQALLLHQRMYCDRDVNTMLDPEDLTARALERGLPDEKYQLAMTMYWSSRIEFVMGRIEHALRAVNLAVSLHNNDNVLVRYRGVIRLMGRDYDGGIEDLRCANKILSRDSETLCWLAQALLLRGSEHDLRSARRITWRLMTSICPGTLAPTILAVRVEMQMQVCLRMAAAASGNSELKTELKDTRVDADTANVDANTAEKAVDVIGLARHALAMAHFHSPNLRAYVITLLEQAVGPNVLSLLLSELSNEEPEVVGGRSQGQGQGQGQVHIQELQDQLQQNKLQQDQLQQNKLQQDQLQQVCTPACSGIVGPVPMLDDECESRLRPLSPLVSEV
jgi:Flp pilus assembly protein TadD